MIIKFRKLWPLNLLFAPSPLIRWLFLCTVLYSLMLLLSNVLSWYLIFNSEVAFELLLYWTASWAASFLKTSLCFVIWVVVVAVEGLDFTSSITFSLEFFCSSLSALLSFSSKRRSLLFSCIKANTFLSMKIFKLLANFIHWEFKFGVFQLVFLREKNYFIIKKNSYMKRSLSRGPDSDFRGKNAFLRGRVGLTGLNAFPEKRDITVYINYVKN